MSCCLAIEKRALLSALFLFNNKMNDCCSYGF